MPLLSSWDALVYGPAVAVFLLLLWARERESVSRAAVVAVPAVAFLIYLPYYLLPAGVGDRMGFPHPSSLSRSGAGSLPSSMPLSPGTSGCRRSTLPSVHRHQLRRPRDCCGPARLPPAPPLIPDLSASRGSLCSPSATSSTFRRCLGRLQPFQHHLQVLLRCLIPSTGPPPRRAVACSPAAGPPASVRRGADRRWSPPRHPVCPQRRHRAGSPRYRLPPATIPWTGSPTSTPHARGGCGDRLPALAQATTVSWRQRTGTTGITPGYRRSPASRSGRSATN